MKMKLNLSGEGIKQFLLNNGEKIGLVITFVVLLGFLYSAVTAKPLDDSKSPSTIQQKSTELTSRIQVPSWQEHLKETPDAVQVDYPKVIAPEMEQVAKAPYVWTTEIDKPIFPDLVKRADPQIYPIEELQISGGRAIISYAAATTTAGGAAMPVPVNNLGGGGGAAAGAQNQHFQATGMPGVAPPSGSEAKAKYFAIITGAIPCEKQIEEYNKKFQNAVPAVQLAVADTTRPGMSGPATLQSQSGATDTPVWFIFRVERAEVANGKENEPLKWDSIPHESLYKEAALDVDKWAVKPPSTPEIVGKDYVFDPIPYPKNNPTMTTYMTWPLPPLVLKDWGMEASHPKVKLIESGTPQAAPAGDNTAPQQSLEDLSGIGAPAPGAPPAAGVAPGGKPGTVQPRFGGAPTPAPQAGAFGGGNNPRPGFASGGFGGFGAQQPVVGQLANQTQQTPPYKLFRFVDLTAEPGKTYRYRVQLVLNNPNFNLRADCLDPKVVKTKEGKVAEWIVSPWAETPPVTIPRDFQLLADSIVPGGRGQEPKAKLDVVAFVKASQDAANATGDVWLEAKSDFDLALGAIADLRNEAFKKVTDMFALEVRDVDKVALDSNQTMLVDLRNDDPLGNSKSGPTEVLLMDAAGHLTIANSAADSQVVKDYMDRTKPPADNLNPAPAPVIVPAPKGGGKAAPVRPNPAVTPKGTTGKKEAQ